MGRNCLIFTLNQLAKLNLSVLYCFSDVMSFVLYYILRYRRKVVRNNLTTSFPAKNLKEIKKIERQFYRYLTDQIVETLKLIDMSDSELQDRVKVQNPEIINSSLEKSKCVVLLMGHYANWEWVQEISRYFIPEAFMASIYHPLNNKTWDNIFLKIRSRWSVNIIPMKKAPRTLLDKSNSPWVCGFIADQWPHNRNHQNFIEFLNHKTWFIYGPEEIGNKLGAEYFYLEMNRLKRGHYEIIFHKLVPEDNSLPFPHTRIFWKEFEKTILRAPAFWLWSHKRWKFNKH